MWPVILLLAAGASSRMGGRDKLLEPVDGMPLLVRQARAAVATGAEVAAVLPPDRPDRAAALAGLGVAAVVAGDAAQGMAASIRAGLAAVRPARGVMILPADMPDLDTAALVRMLDAAAADPAAILRGSAADGTPGHPVVFPPDLRPDLAHLTGDQGARALLAAHRGRLRLVPLPGRAALTDLDTPADWAAWRAARG